MTKLGAFRSIFQWAEEEKAVSTSIADPRRPQGSAPFAGKQLSASSSSPHSQLTSHQGACLKRLRFGGTEWCWIYNGFLFCERGWCIPAPESQSQLLKQIVVRRLKVLSNRLEEDFAADVEI